MSPMTRIRSIVPILVFVAAPSAQVSPELAQLIKKEGLENSKVMDYLDHLTNKIGHRLTGSDNFRRACEWAKSEFEKMGLDAKLEQWGTWRVSWNRGQWQGRILEPIEMDLQVATDAWTAGTKGRVKAEVVRMPTSVDDFDEELKGKWLIARRMPRSTSVSRAASVGAAGILYSSRGDRRFPNRIRVFGSYRRPQRKIVQICIRRDQFLKLWEVTGLAEDSEKKVLAEFDIRNRFRDEPTPLFNVVAEIKGTVHPDEFVIVCGHLDSWHQASGTTDNGTGTTSTMEAARIIAAVGAKPKRTIRFLLWGGEEQGLLGSVQYVRRHRQEMNNVSAVFNHDTGTNWAQSLRVTSAQYDDMRKVIAPVMSMKAPDDDWNRPVFKLSKSNSLGRGGGSDHASFLSAGVPAFPWGLRGRSNYFSYTWHSQWDTYDEAIPEYQRHTSTVIALTALGTANLPHLLGRGGVGRARPRGDAKPVAEGRLGIELEGLKVAGIDKGGVGDRAGMKTGDTIVAINDKRVSSAVDIVSIMRDNKAPWVFTVLRGERKVGLLVELAGKKPKKVGK